MEYYLNEVALAVINRTYSISKAGAPMRAEHNVIPTASILSQSDIELKKIDLNYTDDRAKQFIETFKSVLQAADTLYAKKKFSEAKFEYESILRNLYENTSADTKKTLNKFIEDIQNRIAISEKNNLYQSGSCSERKVHDIQNYFQNHLSKYENLKGKYRSLLYDAYVCSILEKLTKEVQEDDQLLNQAKYKDALKQFRDTEIRLNIKSFFISAGYNGYAADYSIFGEVIDYSKAPEIQNFFSNFQKKFEKIKKNLQNLSTNKLYARCDIIERASTAFDVLKQNGQGESNEAYNALAAFNENYTGLKSEEYLELSPEAYQRYIDVIELGKTSNAYSYTISIKAKSNERKSKRENDAEFKSELRDNTPLDIALFPFKYMFNITISILDIFKITPLVGLGAGAETPILHPGIGDATRVVEIKTAEKRKKRDGDEPLRETKLGGLLLVQRDECTGFIVDFYGIDYKVDHTDRSETCQSDNKWNSVFKLNVWGAAIVGLHFETDLSRAVNVIPEILAMNMQGRKFFWGISNTRKSLRFDYFYRPMPIQKRLEWKIFNSSTSDFNAIRQCKSVNMEVASSEEIEKIEEVEKVEKDSLICVKEK
ncbi:MAG TPA: hypothetical protein PKN56_17275 [Leptospiraceae bacterium]|nr:hypothetical protein [Leptospiraceae bacterium]